MGALHTCACRTAQFFLRLKRTITPPSGQQHQSGEDSVFQLAPYLRSRKLKKPLLLLAAADAPKSSAIELSLMENDIDFAVWNTLPALPTTVDGENIRLYWLGNNCDCIIALGNDRVINLARLVALRVKTPNTTMEQLLRSGKVPNVNIPPVITIPTICGSGTESCSTLFVRRRDGTLCSLVHRRLRPALVISDPNVFRDAPRDELADACAMGLCHAFESYLSPYANKKARFHALRAIEYYFDNTESVWNTGGTRADRKLLAEASYLSGRISAAVSCGYISALVRAVAILTDIRPADAIAALLPTFLVKYGNSVHSRLGELALFTEIGQDCSDEELSQRVILRLRTLFFRIGLADTLDINDTALLSGIAHLAARIANPHWASPVVWSADELYEILIASV